MVPSDQDHEARLDSDEAKENARNIEHLRLSIIRDRWLSTIILTIHIEIEALLVELLRRNLPRPDKLFENRNARPTFAQKLVLCETLGLLGDSVAGGVWALNRLRNELAHRLDDVPTLDALAAFIAAMSAIHPLQVTAPGATSPKQLHTFQQVRSHFLEADRHEVEQFVFVSLLLLRANVVTLLDVAKKSDPNKGGA